MAAIMASVSPDAPSRYVTIADAGKLAGMGAQGVYKAVYRGRLHPVRVKGERSKVVFYSELLAWRNYYRWRPTPDEMAVLTASGYKAEDFTPTLPGELADASATPTPTPTGGAGEAMGAALVSQADVRAFIETVFREGQGVTASAVPLVGSATQGAMRGWAEVAGASASPEDVAGVVAGAVSGVVSGVMRPITETIRDSITPLSEALAQAAIPRPTPPTEDAVERQMGALRVEVAGIIARLLEALRPIVERLTSGGIITPEDVAPFAAFIGELADTIADSEFADVTPRQARALLPGILAHMTPASPSGHVASSTASQGASQGASEPPTPPATPGKD